MEVLAGGISRTVRKSAELPASRFSVTSVTVMNTLLRDEELVSVQGLNDLAALDLAGTGITDRGLESLRKSPNLSQLTLHATQISGS